jgi:hypothetical protein
LRGVAAIVLALGVVSGASAATTSGNGSTPSAATTMSPGAAGILTATGSITGSGNGGFAYYTFNYPGHGAVGNLTMSFTPTDPNTSNAVGVNLWQNGVEIASVGGASTSTPGAIATSFTSASAGPVLVQAYDYLPGAPVSFQISLSGLPTSTPSSTTSGSSSTPSSTTSGSSSTSSGSSSMSSGAGTASAPTALTKAMSGSLQGSGTGAFAYYTVPYPGDGSTRTVAVSFSPSDLDTSNGFFVTIYQNGAVIGSSQGTNNGGTPGVLSVPFGSTVNAPAVIQLANYNPGTTISYTISP